jgi:hypothetical protein
MIIKMLIFYEPVQFRSTTWAILLMQPYNNENITLAMANSTKAMTEPSAAAAVFDKYSRPFGLTYGDWTAKWWQWAYSIPKDVHPAYDDTGKYCTVSQNGPVWFFPGTYGKPVVRECTIPEGKAILLPILNSECSFAEFSDLKTIQELRMCAKTIQDQVTQLHASVDGVDIPESELRKYHIQSPPFNFTLLKDNIFELPFNTTTQAVADGNWVFLKPLSIGNHEISFNGDTANSNVTSTGADTTTSNTTIATTSTSNDGNSFAFPTGWNFETTYRITITSSK